MAVTNLNLPLASAQTGLTNGLRDIRPPVAIPSGWAWLWWLLAAAAAGYLLYQAWRYWQANRRQFAFVPAIPPHVRARQKLAEALALIADPKAFCIEVSGVIRTYLEERFDFRAPERTTEEFLHELQATTLLTPDQKQSLGEFLERCDLVKFARYEPREAELRDLHAAALRLVDETEPWGPEAVGSAPSQTAPDSTADTPHSPLK